MVDIIRGAEDKPVSTEALVEFLINSKISEGLLYVGYPIIGTIDETYSIDALLISVEHGVVIFDIVEESKFEDRVAIRDSLYRAMLQKLLSYKDLASKKRGELKVKISVTTFAPSWNIKHQQPEVIIDKSAFHTFLDENSEDNFSHDDYKRVLQAIQAITKLRLKITRHTSRIDSRGFILNEIEKSISNLDRRQSKAVIETTDGIQRIRGLAGSGKTIVLALKVAYLHSKFPDWTIGVTFYTRSLKNQFIDLITKFTIEHKNEEPDWNKIKILQAWGGYTDNGIYYEYCINNNVEFLDFGQATNKYPNDENLLDLVCKKALDETKAYHEVYNVILIDEAQDFTENFLKICYNLIKAGSVKNPRNKRLIYAYDELQKLSNIHSLKNPVDIFPGIDFQNIPNKPQQDIILEKCYRNSKPVLVSAHALGFGIYRNKGLVTMFQDFALWRDVGYKVAEGTLDFGQDVVLERDTQSSPDFLTSKVPVDDVIKFKSFENTKKQFEWIVKQIQKNLQEDELSYNDIIVIHPIAKYAKNELAPLRALLQEKGILSHIAGVNTSKDDFFIEKSIAFTSIYRAKGNEAAMVYIVNSEYCFDGPELIKKRNTLFTAITRSKAWVRVLGIGSRMESLKKEFSDTKGADFALDFTYPTLQQMEKINVLHRDLTESAKKRISEAESEATNLLSKLANGDVQIEDLSEELLVKLRKAFNDTK